MAWRDCCGDMRDASCGRVRRWRVSAPQARKAGAARRRDAPYSSPGRDCLARSSMIMKVCDIAKMCRLRSARCVHAERSANAMRDAECTAWRAAMRCRSPRYNHHSEEQSGAPITLTADLICEHAAAIAAVARGTERSGTAQRQCLRDRTGVDESAYPGACAFRNAARPLRDGRAGAQRGGRPSGTAHLSMFRAVQLDHEL